MKKFFILMSAVLLVCGVVFIGVQIFNSTTVKEVKLVGQMQQIYFSGDEVSFGDAKLMVTYQNGNIKMLDMGGKVNVSSFSTAGHGSYFGTMKITHKTQTVEVDYSVIDRTSYQIIDSTAGKKKIVDFGINGKCRYFEIENNKFYMHDGAKDDLYNYHIVGNEIILELGKNVEYKIKTKIEGNSISIESSENKINSSNNIFTRFETTNDIKTNNTKDIRNDLKLSYDKLKFTSKVVNNSRIINIPEGKNIADSGLCLIVDYDNGEVYNVYLTQSMINGNGVDEYGKYYLGAYESRAFKIYYQFV